jgi:hypothetical protein
MAKPRIFNITSFNGGMTQNLRDTRDLSKCAYVSHFDIYRDPNQMYVMPGFIDDMSIGGDADGMKVYGIRAINYIANQVWAVGTKADGTGSKLFQKADPDTAEWSSPANGEGTDDLAAFTFIAGDEMSFPLYWLTVSGGTQYLTEYDLASVNDKIITYGGVNTSIYAVAEQYYTLAVYSNEPNSTGLTLLQDPPTEDVKTTTIFPRDIQTGGEQMGIFGSYGAGNGIRRSRLLLWDTQSLLVDQNIDFGDGLPIAIGYPSGYWVGIVDEGFNDDTSLQDSVNDSPSIAVKVASNSASETLFRLYGATSSGGLSFPTRSKYRDSMLWYFKGAINTAATEFREGVWACGKGNINDPLAVSVLLDTSSLGNCQVVKSIGTHIYLVHGGDGSISRLDSFDDGTFDVPATYESLVFGGDTPFLKELDGVSIVTEDLPSGASVAVSYRTDLNSSWTLMNTSSTAGQRKHNFTRVAGVPIGKFQEIQFKVVVTGKVQVKNILVAMTEFDDLPFSA